MSGPRPHVARDTAQSERVGLHRIFKGEEQPDAVREVSRASIQIQGQGILVPRLLCRHDRQKHGENCSVYPKSIEGGQVRRPTDHAREDVARLRAAGKDNMQMPVCPTRRDAWLVS